MAENKKAVEEKSSTAKAKKSSSISMTDEEKKEFDALYYYVKKSIMLYDDNQMLPKFFVLRLKGLASGEFIHKKANAPTGVKYGYKIILLTFIRYKDNIMYGVTHNSFKDNEHKINYIMAIVESKINDVYEQTVIEKEIRERKEITGEQIYNEYKDIIGKNSSVKQEKSKKEAWRQKYSDMW